MNSMNKATNNNLESPVPDFIIKKLGFYFVCFVVFVVIKILFKNIDNWNFLIAPVNKIVEIATNSNSVFVAPCAYYHEKCNIIINKSCSGLNFWMICFLLLSFVTSKYIKKVKYCFALLPLLLAGSYGMAVAVNALRIIYFVNTKSIRQFLGLTKFSWLHQAEGAFIYLSSLILIYLICEYIIHNLKGEENA